MQKVSRDGTGHEEVRDEPGGHAAVELDRLWRPFDGIDGCREDTVARRGGTLKQARGLVAVELDRL